MLRSFEEQDAIKTMDCELVGFKGYYRQIEIKCGAALLMKDFIVSVIGKKKTMYVLTRGSSCLRLRMLWIC